MDINPSSSLYAAGSYRPANGERGASAASKENQNSSKYVSSDQRVDNNTERYSPSSAKQDSNVRLVDASSSSTSSNRVFEEIEGRFELQSQVIEQKKNPAVQAFLDIRDTDSDFHLVDVYV